MELLDLWPLEKWAALENEIRDRSDLNAAVFNVDGIRINNKPHWPNRLCPQIKANPKGQSFICATAHMNIAHQAKQTREPVIEECDAGLVKLLVPIFVGDTFLGAVSGCGLLLEDGQADTFLVNKITGIDNQTLDALKDGIPSLSRQQAEQILAFIQQRLEQIVAAYQTA